VLFAWEDLCLDMAVDSESLSLSLLMRTRLTRNTVLLRKLEQTPFSLLNIFLTCQRWGPFPWPYVF
jgi:hypothetical protein